jgi:hypothetical protein
MEALQFFETSGTTDPLIQCHIPEGFNPQLKSLIKKNMSALVRIELPMENMHGVDLLVLITTCRCISVGPGTVSYIVHSFSFTYVHPSVLCHRTRAHVRSSVVIKLFCSYRTSLPRVLNSKIIRKMTFMWKFTIFWWCVCVYNVWELFLCPSFLSLCFSK